MTFLPGCILHEIIYENERRRVYRGESGTDRTPVIVKTLKEERAEPADIAGLVREYEIIRRLDIPGIIRPEKLDRSGALPALVMPDTGAVSLTTFFSPNPPELTTFLSLARQLADTLGKIHEKGVIHRNLKPGHILTQPSTGQVYIIDFSAALLFPGENPAASFSGTPAGTPAYMSPEQTGRVNRPVDPRSDLYSLGVLFYELLTGRLPFRADDPIRWVHAHLTQKPPSPGEINPAIPAPLCGIILKLLAKTPEERYQSAAGLLWDLAEWDRPGFQAGRREETAAFHLPRELYDRKTETAALKEAFSGLSSGDGRVVMVRGFAGTGKTVLIKETLRPLCRDQGFFITGKFDQLQQKVPYAAVLQALRDLIRQLMTESKADIIRWKSRLGKALGRNGGVVTELLPEAAAVLGPHPGVEPLPPLEAQHRFRMVFRDFFRACAGEKHPLILFLDDLHWADTESLYLIRHLSRDPENRFLLIIGAYRDNEVDALHPLARTLDELKTGEIPVRYLTLAPLSRTETGRFIAHTLHCPAEQAASLTDTLYRKSQGNPFFLGQLLKSLYQEKQITYCPRREGWVWDAAALEDLPIPRDVVDFMLDKLRQLPEEARHILPPAACIGNTFDLKTLSVACEKTMEETAACLAPLNREGLIRPLPSAYEFIHDRIHEAAYALIPAAKKKQAHLKIGRLMLRDTGPDRLEDQIFAVMDQLNQGLELLDDPEEKLELARHNLTAGKKAKASAAFGAALSYFRAGLALLSDRSWQDHYRLTFDLHLECAQCIFLCGDLPAAGQMFDRLLEQAEKEEDRLDVCALQMVLYAGTGKCAEAIRLGLRVLAGFGMKLPIAPGKLDYVKEVVYFKWHIRAKKIEALADLPEMTDPVQKKAAEFLILLACVAYTSNPELHGLVIIKAANHSVKYGNTEGSVIGYLGYAITAGSILGDYRAGHRYMQVCLKLAEKCRSSLYRCIVSFVVGALISHWTEHGKTGITHLENSLHYSQLAGDVLLNGYARSVILETKYLLGFPLEEIARETGECEQYGKMMQQEGLLANTRIYRHLVDVLQGREERDALQPEGLDAEPTLLVTYYVAQLQLAFFFGDYEKALALGAETEKSIHYVTGFMLFAEHTFYYALAIAAAYHGLPEKNRKKYRKILEKKRRRLEKWADAGPANYRHKYLLVAGETARLQGRGQDAAALYDQAVQCAREHGYLHHEALANELAAGFYLSLGREKLARPYLADACRSYGRWGAAAKVLFLQERFPGLCEAFPEKKENLLFFPSPAGQTGSLDSWDMQMIKKALQSFSEETRSDVLLENFLDIAVESTGADKGYLILEKEGELYVEGAEPLRLENYRYLSRGIVRYVARTLETVVAGGEEQVGAFVRDPYIREAHPASVACFPMLFRGIPAGVLYLENSRIPGVFTPDRLEILKYLSTQMAFVKALEKLFAGNTGETGRKGNGKLDELLTDREKEVLNLIGAGMSNKEIAQVLDMTVNTVKTHVKNIYGKLCVNNRVQAAARAKELAGR
ncbi:MAG: AAA family ATPase [Bacillota bacterium]